MGAANMAGNIGVFFTEAILGFMIDHIRQTGGDWNQVVFDVINQLVDAVLVVRSTTSALSGFYDGYRIRRRTQADFRFGFPLGHRRAIDLGAKQS